MKILFNRILNNKIYIILSMYSGSSYEEELIAKKNHLLIFFVTILNFAKDKKIYINSYIDPINVEKPRMIKL